MIVAWVLLPDHLHTVWTLPQEDDRYSRRWQKIKEEFAKTYLAAGGHEGVRNRSRASASGTCRLATAILGTHGTRRGGPAAMRRLRALESCEAWLARRVRDWPWSTFHRFVAAGDYDIDWGASDPSQGTRIPNGASKVMVVVVGWARADQP